MLLWYRDGAMKEKKTDRHMDLQADMIAEREFECMHSVRRVSEGLYSITIRVPPFGTTHYLEFQEDAVTLHLQDGHQAKH